MSWQLALGAFFVFIVIQTLLQRSYSQSHSLPETFPPLLVYLLGVMPGGVIIGLITPHHVQWSWWLVLLLVGEGIFIGLYNWLAFLAMRRLALARFQTIFQLYELVVVALGWIILGEGLGIWQLIGGALILIAAYLAIRAPQKNQSELARTAGLSAVGLAVLSAVVLGIGLVIEKAALGHMDRGAYYIFGFGTQTLALVILAAKDISRHSLRAIKPKDYRKSFELGLATVLGGMAYITAIVLSDNISLITALAAFQLPLIVLGGYLVLKERDDLKLLLGGVSLGFIGLLLSALH